MSCRVCLEEKPEIELSHLSKNPISKIKYFNLIKFCTGIEITDSENHPKFVCKSCLEKLEIAKEIKAKCIESDGILNSIVPEVKDTKQIGRSCGKRTFLPVDPVHPTSDALIESTKKGSADSKRPNGQNFRGSGKSIRALPVGQNSVFKTLKKDTVISTTRRVSTRSKEKIHSMDHLETSPESGNINGIHENQLSEAFIIQEFKKETELNIVDVINPNAVYDCHEIINESTLENKPFIENSVVSHKTIPQKKPSKENYYSSDENSEKIDLVCEFCGLRAKSKQGLVLHISKAHVDRENPMYCCDLCGNNLRSRTNLEKHMEMHGRQIAYFGKFTTFCEICQKVFLNINKLAKHHYDHHNAFKVKEFKCQICSKFYSNRHSLKVHKMDVHLKMKNYKCYKCDAKFKRNQSLTEHLASHDNLFKCPKCFKSFKSIKGWKQHMQKRKGTCRFCCKNFLLVSNKIKHMKKMHFNQK